jgi:CRP/FNR family cyclic AMP-dependent transcriptional regulator
MLTDRGRVVTAEFVATFFDPGTVDAHERPDEFSFLADRSQSDWRRILEYTETRRFDRGEVLVESGDADRSLILLTEGTIGVRLAGDGRRTFKAIDAPSVVGEVAFLDGGPRSATLFAIAGGELLRLRMARFEVLAAHEPELGRAILLDLARIVTRRLRLASDVIARTQR